MKCGRIGSENCASKSAQHKFSLQSALALANARSPKNDNDDLDSAKVV